MTTANKTRLAFLAFVLCFASGARAITLEAALARTLEKNPVIQDARIRLEEAAGQRLVLRATALPDVKISIPLGVQGGHRAGENSVQPFAFAQGYFRQPLFDARIPASYRRGNIEVLIAQQRLNLAVAEQLHTARVAYYTAAHNQSLRALGEAQRARLETNVRTQTERYQIGEAQRGAVTVAQVLEQEIRPRLEESQRISSGALLQLAQTMGADLGPSAVLPRVDGDLPFVPTALNVASETNAAIAERPDLQLARLLVRAAAEDQRIIEAAYYPAISGEISGNYIPVTDIHRGSEGTARPSDDVVSSELRGGAIYSWRVIDNGKVGGAVLRAKAAKEINQAVLARLEANVPRELSRIQNNLRALEARHTALEKAAIVAEQSVTDVQSNLLQGRSSQLEYRTAESSFLETKAGLLTVAFEENLALAERDRVTGRYFQFSGDTGAKVH
ncbi:MAG: TolC family protein [Verrucomicrobiota bacterium]|nr:TolC family protein [Verrucomicrobiota bacterium]